MDSAQRRLKALAVTEIRFLRVCTYAASRHEVCAAGCQLTGISIVAQRIIPKPSGLREP